MRGKLVTVSETSQNSNRFHLKVLVIVIKLVLINYLHCHFWKKIKISLWTPQSGDISDHDLWAFLELDSTKNVSLSISRPKVRNSNWFKWALPTKHWYFVLLVLGSRMDNCHFVHQKVMLWLLKQKFAFFHKRELANTYLMIIFSKKIMSRLKVYFSSWAKLWFWGIRNVARLPRFQGFVWKVSGSWENRCTVRYLFIFQILVKWHVSIFLLGNRLILGSRMLFESFYDFGGSETYWAPTYRKETSWESLVSEKSSAQCVTFLRHENQKQ